MTRFFFQTTKRLRNLYSSWTGVMKGTEPFSSRGSAPTQDAIGNALYLWARDQKPEELARVLEPYVNQFEATWEKVPKSKKGVAGPQVSETRVFGPASSADQVSPGRRKKRKAE